MMDIQLRSIPHSEQRYSTTGDWRGDHAGQIEVTVSELGDWRYEFLIGLHELIEATLCNQRGIRDTRVTAFDKMFEAERTIGRHSPEAEPGDDPRAPYRREHFFATSIERLMAVELGVDWSEYEKAIEAL